MDTQEEHNQAVVRVIARLEARIVEQRRERQHGAVEGLITAREFIEEEFEHVCVR